MKIPVLPCVLALVLAGTSQASATDDPHDPAMVAVDAVIVRPFCLAGTIIGSTFFVISLPWAAASKSVHQARRALIVKPWNATFNRALGDFDAMSAE